MITEKENYIRFITGKDVAFAPTMNLMGMVGPSYLYKDRNPDMSGFDFYGVEYVVSPESNGGFIPVPGKFILDDVTKWHDVIKNPDISGLDWEEMAKKDMAHIDRENVPVCANFIPGFFQAFINFMGFTEGLCAIYEEPEEVKALTEYITDFYCEVAKKMVEYYKPDMMWLPDDVCTQRAPFISKAAYDEIFMPSIKKYARVFIDNGIPVEIHCCGECMDLIEDWVEAGITAWDPAQVMNDLIAVHNKYGKDFAIIGGWDSSGPIARGDVTDQELIDAVDEWCDTYLPLGGFGFAGGVMGAIGDPEVARKNGIVFERFKEYSKKFF